MKQYVQFPLKLLGYRALFIVVTLFFLPIFIGPIGTWIEGDLGLKLYNVVVCSLYMGIVYDAGWKLAKLDKKPYTAEKPYAPKGFFLGLLSEIIPIIILICNGIFQNIKAFRTLYSIVMFPFIGFLGNREQLAVPASYIVLFVVPVFSGLGYLVGLRNKKDEEGFISKIMYKKK